MWANNQDRAQVMDYVSGLDKFTSSYVDDGDTADVILADRISNSMSERNRSDSSSNILYYVPEEVANFTDAPEFINATVKNVVGYRDSLSILIPISICYCIIFITGILGNVITCVVIAKNKTMHTATNYYLFNLAVSDFLVLIFGMPFDFMNIWLPNSYPFEEIVCILQGLLSETSTNATILTITSFTCERYIAICHPFRSHTMSKLSRVEKFICVIWIVAFALAAPQALQFGTVVAYGGVSCSVKTRFEHAFEISSFVFFIVPMTVICVLYILIGIKLRQSKLLYGKKIKGSDNQRYIKGQSRVIRMLIAVVVMFFLCWAPFHAQRIMAVYGKIMNKSFSSDDLFMRIYIALTYISGITYFLSTCINPFLYNIMSHKFRNASKLTLVVHCLSRSPSNKQTQLGSNYSALTLNRQMLPMTLNRNQFVFPTAQNTSEIIQINDEGHTNEIGNCASRATDSGPCMMDHPYHSVVRFSSINEPSNYSCSQQTCVSTVSYDILKRGDIHVDKDQLSGAMKSQREKSQRRSSLVETFKKALVSKTDDSLSICETPTNEAISALHRKIPTSNEDDNTSSELVETTHEINEDVRNQPKS